MEDYYTDCRGEKWVDPEGAYSDQAYKCYVCQEGTHRIDIGFNAPVHSGDCYSRIWEEFYASSVKFVPVDG